MAQKLRSVRIRNERVLEGPDDATVAGSHGSSKVAIIASCGLCQQVKPLLLSHVVPKWAAQWSKAEGAPRGLYNSIGAVTETPDYPKYYLLCFDCEQLLGTAEGYTARLCKGTASELKAAGIWLRPGDQVTFLHKVDTSLVFQAIAGTMLRAHLAPHILFKRTTLSKHEVKELRRAILSGNFPADRFAMFASKWMNTTVPGANPRSLLFPAFERRLGGAEFDLTMGGMSWTLFLGPTPQWKQFILPESGGNDPFFLGFNDRWKVVTAEWTGLRHLAPKDQPDYELKFDSDWDSVAKTDPCPCGLLGVTFAECCEDRWAPGVKTLTEIEVSPGPDGTSRSRETRLPRQKYHGSGRPAAAILAATWSK
jgi:hypothetical protein